MNVDDDLSVVSCQDLPLDKMLSKDLENTQVNKIASNNNI